MQQPYVALNPDVEVSGQLVFSIAYASKRSVEQRLAILAKNGISALAPENWYPLQSVLDSLKEISDTFGDMTMMLMAKDLALRSPLPPHIGDLRHALDFLNIVNLMNHRLHGKLLFDPQTGEKYCPEAVGENVVVEFNESEKFAKTVGAGPYPVSNVIGWLTGFVERFVPERQKNVFVREDFSVPKTEDGSHTLLINW